MERANTTEADPIGVPKIFKIGIPIGFQMLAEIAVFSVCALHAGQFGERSESAHQIALGLASFTFMGALGISAGTAVRVGIAVGEGRSPAKIGLAGIALGSVVQSFGALVFFLWPTQLAGLFSTDTEVIRIGVQLLYIAAVFQLFDGMQAVAGGALRGIGDVRAAFVLNLVSYWVIGYPISLALAFGTNQLSAWNPAKYLAMPFKAVEGQGVRGLWLGLTVALVAVSLSMTGRFIALARKPIARL
jgi:MATE family multidrug resistance protein